MVRSVGIGGSLIHFAGNDCAMVSGMLALYGVRQVYWLWKGVLSSALGGLVSEECEAILLDAEAGHCWGLHAVATVTLHTRLLAVKGKNLPGGKLHMILSTGRNPPRE